MPNSFEDFLQDKFMELREIGGRAITKDSAEDMFDGWLSNLDGGEYMDYADAYGKAIIEKLIWDFTGHCSPEVVQQLKAKWLGNNIIAGVDFTEPLSQLNKLGKETNA